MHYTSLHGHEARRGHLRVRLTPHPFGIDHGLRSICMHSFICHHQHLGYVGCPGRMRTHVCRLRMSFDDVQCVANVGHHLLGTNGRKEERNDNRSKRSKETNHNKTTKLSNKGSHGGKVIHKTQFTAIAHTSENAAYGTDLQPKLRGSSDVLGGRCPKATPLQFLKVSALRYHLLRTC